MRTVGQKMVDLEVDFGYHADAVFGVSKMVWRCLFAFAVSIPFFVCLLWKLRLTAP